MTKKRDILLLAELDPYYPPIEVNFTPTIRVKVKEIDLIRNKVIETTIYRGKNFGQVLEKIIKYGIRTDVTRLIVEVPPHLEANEYYKDFVENITNYFGMEPKEVNKDGLDIFE